LSPPNQAADLVELELREVEAMLALLGDPIDSYPLSGYRNTHGHFLDPFPPPGRSVNIWVTFINT